MAKPIAPTPDLKGKEAEKFLKEVRHPKMGNVTREDVLRGKRIFEVIERNTKAFIDAV